MDLRDRDRFVGAEVAPRGEDRRVELSLSLLEDSERERERVSVATSPGVRIRDERLEDDMMVKANEG